MVRINAPGFVINLAADVGTHLLHLSLCDTNSVLTKETFKASQRAGRFCKLTNCHCAGILDGIMAASFALGQSETILARS